MGGPGVAQERSRHLLRHHLVTRGQASQRAFAMTWQWQHGCLASSPCPDPGSATAIYKAAPLSVTRDRSELGLSYHEPQLAQDSHNRRTTGPTQKCSAYLRDLSLARLLGTTARIIKNLPISGVVWKWCITLTSAFSVSVNPGEEKALLNYTRSWCCYYHVIRLYRNN